jgi:hypothetical protein
VKIERELNVDLMDMGMSVTQEDDRKVLHLQLFPYYDKGTYLFFLL